MKTVFIVQTLDKEDEWVSQPVVFSDDKLAATWIEQEYPEHILDTDFDWSDRKMYFNPNAFSSLIVLLFKVRVS